MINTVKTWLSAYPGLEGLTLEALAPLPGSAGLFCRGEEVVRRMGDILGTERLRKRLGFTLAVHTVSDSMPQQLLELAQRAKESAPILGQDQALTLEKGALTRCDAEGTARYELHITFEFTQ